MRKLGAEIGADPMAIYHYLPNKAALFDGIVEIIWAGSRSTPMDAAQPWTELAAVAMRRFRNTAAPAPGRGADRPAPGCDHPRRAQRSSTPRWGFLTAAGLQPDEAIALMNCLAAFHHRPPTGRRQRSRRRQGRAPQDIYAALSRRAVPPSARALTGAPLDPNDQFGTRPQRSDLRLVSQKVLTIASCPLFSDHVSSGDTDVAPKPRAFGDPAIAS